MNKIELYRRFDWSYSPLLIEKMVSGFSSVGSSAVVEFGVKTLHVHQCFGQLVSDHTGIVGSVIGLFSGSVRVSASGGYVSLMLVSIDDGPVFSGPEFWGKLLLRGGDDIYRGCGEILSRSLK